MSDQDWVDGGTFAVWTRVVSLWSMVGAAWAAVDWARLASTTAFLYSLVLLGEWWWKRFGRPAAETLGWVQPRYRRRTDKPGIKK